MNTAYAMLSIFEERRRQQQVEGRTIEHDDAHNRGELAMAAAVYAGVAGEQAAGEEGPFSPPPGLWPWDREDFKPKDARRNLVRSAALLIAEIERIDRATARQKP